MTHVLFLFKHEASRAKYSLYTELAKDSGYDVSVGVNMALKDLPVEKYDAVFVDYKVEEPGDEKVKSLVLHDNPTEFIVELNEHLCTAPTCRN